VIFSFLCISLSNACITLATALRETWTLLANLSLSSSLSHVESCSKNEVVASLSSTTKIKTTITTTERFYFYFQIRQQFLHQIFAREYGYLRSAGSNSGLQHLTWHHLEFVSSPTAQFSVATLAQFYNVARSSKINRAELKLDHALWSSTCANFLF
jgi:hypothetical protein